MLDLCYGVACGHFYVVWIEPEFVMLLREDGFWSVCVSYVRAVLRSVDLF